MWTSAKQQILNDLCRRELDGNLTRRERKELSQLVSEINDEEQKQLAPHLRKLDREMEQLQEKVTLIKAQSDRLTEIVSRQKDLVRKARTQLHELRQERKKLLTVVTH